MRLPGTSFVAEFAFDVDVDEVAYVERKVSKQESEEALKKTPNMCMVQLTWIRSKIKFIMDTGFGARSHFPT